MGPTDAEQARWADQFARALDEVESGNLRRAALSFEEIRSSTDSVWAEWAAYQLGLICTAHGLSEATGRGYALSISEGRGDLAALMTADSGRAGPIPSEGSPYLAQVLRIEDGRPFAAWWDPCTRTMNIHPQWVGAWLERLTTGEPLDHVELMLAKAALGMQFHLMTQAAGPELVEASLPTTGFSTYRRRWAKGWEEGVSQVAVQTFFGELVESLGLADHDQLREYHPMPMSLAPQEGRAVEGILTWLEYRGGLGAGQAVRKLAGEFPDTRLDVLAQLLNGSSADNTGYEDKAAGRITTLIQGMFESFAMEERTPQTMAETAYAIAYRAFQGEGGSPVDRQQTLSAQQALAVLLPQATSFEDVGIILGQGGSLATLRALVESGHLRN